MYDLKKVEKKFHEYLKSRLYEKMYRIDELRITEELLEKQAAFYMPFGWVSYFLVIEDGKPVVYAHACSRMDVDVIAFIDENGYEDYDVWDGDHPDISKKYFAQADKVKAFNFYDDMKYIMNNDGSWNPYRSS